MGVQPICSLNSQVWIHRIAEFSAMVRETSFCMRGSEYEIHNGSECRENLTVQSSALHTDITLSKAEETLRERVQKEQKGFHGKGCREVLTS